MDVSKRLGAAGIGLLIAASVAAGGLTADFSVLVGPYLGQEPPGLQPVPFADGLIRFAHSSISISPDGTEIYWAERTGNQWTSRIVFTRRSGDRWSDPTPLFGGQITGADCPVISPDGRFLVFNSIHPLAVGERERERLWISEREGDGWSEPTPVDGGVNTFGLHWQCGVDAEGNLYFGAVPPAGGTDDDIYVARRLDGSYAVPSRHPISTDLEETTPFVDPAGGYVIVSRVGPTGGHLAVSFRASDGSWADPVALDLSGAEYPVCPYVSPDGAYLFFLSGAKVYWVDARVIDEARRGREAGDP